MQNDNCNATHLLTKLGRKVFFLGAVKAGKNAREHAAFSVEVAGLGAAQGELDSMCRELLRLWTGYMSGSTA